MTTLLLAFFKKHLVAFALVAALIAAGAVLYIKGWSDRGTKEQSASQSKTIERNETRGKTNDKVQKMDGAAICNALGGVYRNDKCE